MDKMLQNLSCLSSNLPKAYRLDEIAYDHAYPADVRKRAKQDRDALLREVDRANVEINSKAENVAVFPMI